MQTLHKQFLFKLMEIARLKNFFREKGELNK